MRAKYIPFLAVLSILVLPAVRAQDLSFSRVVDTVLVVEASGVLSGQIFDGTSIAPPPGKVWKLSSITFGGNRLPGPLVYCNDDQNSYSSSGDNLKAALVFDDGVNTIPLKTNSFNQWEGDDVFEPFDFNPGDDREYPIWFSSGSSITAMIAWNANTAITNNSAPTDICTSNVIRGEIAVSILEFSTN